MKIQRETDIFISYKSEDGWNYAKDLHSALNKKGYAAFLSSNDLREGNYEQQLYKKIDECIYMVVILSPKALINCDDEEKCWVRKEVRYALQNNKKIIPVMLYGFEWPKKLPVDMEGFDKLQGIQVPYEKQYYNDSFEKIEALLKGSIKLKNRYRIVRGDKKLNYKISKKLKRNIILLFSALLMIVLGITAGAFFIKNTRFVYNPDTMYKITLTAPEEMSVKDFEANVEKVKKRFDILADDENYSFEENKDSVKVIIPKKIFHNVDVEQALKCYITRPLELYAFNKSDRVAEEKIKIKRDDLKSVAIKDGAVNGVDAKSLGIKENTYPYIEVVLTDQCAEKLKGRLAEWKDNFAFGQDLEMYSSNFYYYETYPQKDGKTFYIIDKDFEGTFPELMVYNLKNDPTTEGFGVGVSIEAEWEKIDKLGQTVGKYQCDEKDLKEGTISIVYSVVENLSDGEWLDTEKVMKERMDTLKQPYAFGTRKNKDSKGKEKLDIVIKTGLEHMNEDIMKVLPTSSYNFKIQSGLEECWPHSDMYNFTVRQKGSQYAFSMAPKDTEDYLEKSKKEEIRKVNKLIEFAKKHNNVLTLKIDEIPYSDVNISTLTEEGNIEFTNLHFLKKESVDEKNVWMLNLLDVILNGTKFPKYVYFDKYQFNETAEEKLPSVEQFGVVNVEKKDEEEKMKSNLSNIWPDAKIGFEGQKIEMSFDMDVDENFPRKCTSLVKEIYEKSGFEKSSFDSLALYFIKEKVDERARIFFSKCYQNIESKEKGYIYAHGIFTSGRLEKYKNQVKEIVENDSFYKEMSKGDLSSWRWGW